MTRLKEHLHAGHGWLNLIKPEGVSSSHALRPLRKVLGRKVKVGHIGTLDPFASGVLPVAIGEATKTINFIKNIQKIYTATILWGLQTDTLDITGQVEKAKEGSPSLEDLKRVAKRFIGCYEQMPPRFSAKKVEGVRAYKLARQNVEEIALTPQLVECFGLEVLQHDETKGETELQIECGTGFYIRALVRDIAAEIGCLATLKQLKRTRDGKFLQKNGIVLDSLKKELYSDGRELKTHLLPVDYVLDDILAFEVSQEESARLKLGQRVGIATTPIYGLIKAMHAGELVAICNCAAGEVAPSVLSPIKVFNYAIF